MLLAWRRKPGRRSGWRSPASALSWEGTPGIGLTVLAVGTVIGEYEPSLFMIFLAGFLGFLTVCLGVWFAATSPRWGSDGD